MMTRFCFPGKVSVTMGVIGLAVMLQFSLPAAAGEHPRGKDKSSTLQISLGPVAGTVTVSWNGKGVLKQSTTLNGKFKPVRTRGGSHTATADTVQMIYTADSVEGVFSVNAVGYVNVSLPPGLTLLCNPLRAEENTVDRIFVFPVPDGTQVYKYVTGVGYEVSAYDAAQGLWSNPDMDLSPGIGFFFNNPSSETVGNTFIGEVLQGTLVNTLPEGFSTEGALVPQMGSINDLHHIPGEPGDLFRLYVNDGQGGGDYVTSVFSATENRWEPDLILNPAQGFISEKQHAQDWVRVFSILP